jgi:hypothetical protein
LNSNIKDEQQRRAIVAVDVKWWLAQPLQDNQVSVADDGAGRGRHGGDGNGALRNIRRSTPHEEQLREYHVPSETNCAAAASAVKWGLNCAVIQPK